MYIAMEDAYNDALKYVEDIWTKFDISDSVQVINQYIDSCDCGNLIYQVRDIPDLINNMFFQFITPITDIKFKLDFSPNDFIIISNCEVFLVTSDYDLDIACDTMEMLQDIAYHISVGNDNSLVKTFNEIAQKYMEDDVNESNS